MNKQNYELRQEDKVLFATEIIKFLEISTETLLQPILDEVLKLVDAGVRLEHFEKLKSLCKDRNLSPSHYLEYFRNYVSEDKDLNALMTIIQEERELCSGKIDNSEKKDKIINRIGSLLEYKDYNCRIKINDKFFYEGTIKSFLIDYLNEKYDLGNFESNWFSLDHLRKLLYIILVPKEETPNE